MSDALEPSIYMYLLMPHFYTRRWVVLIAINIDADTCIKYIDLDYISNSENLRRTDLVTGPSVMGHTGESCRPDRIFSHRAVTKTHSNPQLLPSRISCRPEYIWSTKPLDLLPTIAISRTSAPLSQLFRDPPSPSPSPLCDSSPLLTSLAKFFRYTMHGASNTFEAGSGLTGLGFLSR